MLGTVRAAILQCLGNPALRMEDLMVLEAMMGQYGALESQWTQIAAFCDRVPRTLVHGDLAAKNARIRASQDGNRLMILDWETAGWGVPAIDLAQFTAGSLSPSLTAYSQSRDRLGAIVDWPEGPELALLAGIGGIFRLIAAASWETDSLLTPWVERSMRNMKNYHAAMAACLREARWGE
jgi:aminoglycoside phosphotransferase (APT) family kinase protein